MSQPEKATVETGEFNNGNINGGGNNGSPGSNNDISNTGNKGDINNSNDTKPPVDVPSQTSDTTISNSINSSQPTMHEAIMSSTTNAKRPTNTNFDKSLESPNKPSSIITLIGISSVAVLLIIVLVLFMFLKKRKRNNKNSLDRIKTDKSETEYQIGSEFLKTDNHLTLPFGDSLRESTLTSDVVSESVFYKNNANVIGSYGEIIKVDENNKMVDNNDINIDIDNNINNGLNDVPHASSNQKFNNEYENNSDNNYCLDVKFETPTLDIAFPKPTHKASSSLSSGWYNNENFESKPTNEINNDKGRFNNLTRPEQALATEGLINIESLHDNDNEVTNIDGKIYLKKKDDSLSRPNFSKKQMPMSNISTNSSNSSINSPDDVVKHSPQANLTPKKSILKKNGSIRNYTKSNSSNSVSNTSTIGNNTLSRNASIKKTTIGGSTITINNNINLSSLSGSSNSINEEELEFVSQHSLNRGNTINSSTTSASNLTFVRLPPVLSAFHHALPTPPTPTSARLFGTDGDFLSGHPINEDLMVPDILTNAIGDRDVYNQEGRNLAGPYCTIRRNKNKNPRRFGSDNNDQLVNRQGSIGRKSSTHRRNRSQDFTHGNDKLDHYNSKSSNKQDDINDKENQQIGNRRENYMKLNKPTNNLHYSKTLPRSYGSSKKYNDYDNNGVYSKKVANVPSLDNLKNKIKQQKDEKDHIKRNSMEADILVQNANIPLTCFEEDLLKISITEKDKSLDINSVLYILNEERKLLDQDMLATP